MEESLFPTTMDALFDYPVTFVTCNNSRDIHVFVPETFDWILVQDIANNFT